MDEAQKLRARAARYRVFAELACDGATQRTRLTRAAHYERLADERHGPVAIPSPSPGHIFAAGPLMALRRVLGRASAIFSAAG